MNNNKNILTILFFFILHTATLSAQSFPTNWLGVWKGELSIESNKQINNVAMELHILPIADSINYWQWTIIYVINDSIRNERVYELYKKSDSSKEYFLDEKNSIILDMRYHNNTFYSHFLVNDNFLTTSYRLTERGIETCMIMSKQNNANNSGGEKGIPMVYSYPIQSIQTALLKKYK